ncbi:alanine racemase [Verrucomicrobia bacterium]|nr:alanine racemase [Verrucomicrobiota bacterium]
MPNSYRCWAEVNLDALRNNLMVLRQLVDPEVKIMTVVKADAYGHGLRQTAALLMQSGTDIFGVANLTEARNIRKVGKGWPILMLGACLPSEIDNTIKDGLMVTVSCVEEANALSDAARRLRAKVQVHLKVDTGMSRLGCTPGEVLSLGQKIQALPGLKWVGIFSHFASIDSDPRFCSTQRKRFIKILNQLSEAGIHLPYRHLHNSGGVIWENQEGINLVRPGSLVYGVIPPSPRKAPVGLADKLKPALSWKCRVALIKEIPKGATVSYGRTFKANTHMSIAILTAGYGDGYMRAGSGKAEVLIKGRRCPILGRITMDQIIVDITPLKGVLTGDEVVMIGRQGEEEIHVTELAEWNNTIPLEILTNITYRVPRIYRGAAPS